MNNINFAKVDKWGEFVYTTKLIRLSQFLKRRVSAAAVDCPYDKIDKVDRVFHKMCVSASVHKGA